MRQKWAQLERDGETGLDYAQNRYYGSTMGRFTSVDPYDINMERQGISDVQEANAVFNEYISNPQHWNRYAYALNNPLKYVDPNGLAEKITVKLNIVYDEEKFTREQAEAAIKKHLERLQKVYGKIDIAFDVTYTAGSAERLTSTKDAKITKGTQEGAWNIFVTSRNENHMGGAWSKSDIGVTFFNVQANSTAALLDEAGHQFGFPSKTALTNLWDDFVVIAPATTQMEYGSLIEGRDWVDDYRKETQSVPRGRYTDQIVPRKPTTYDIWRVGARRFEKKP